MTSLPEQFAAARKTQFTAGFDFFHSLANQAVESAGRVAALNLATSRDALERSARTAQILLGSPDPRNFPRELAGHAEEQARSLFAYGRELMSIAGAIRPAALRAAVQPVYSEIETVAFKAVVPAPQAAAPSDDVPAPSVVAAPPAPAAPEAAPAAAEPEPASAVAADAAPAEPLVAAEPEAAVELIVTDALEEPAPVPVAAPKVIARAAAKGVAQAAVLPHPASAPVPAIGEVALPKIPVPGPRRKK